jgi:8-oxo-dGTP pyrophosphatase MutT (NUDIX family)
MSRLEALKRTNIGLPVWHDTQASADEIATKVEGLSHDLRFKRTVTVIITEGTNYLRVLGNTWGKDVPIPIGSRLIRNHLNPARPLNTDPIKIYSNGGHHYMVPNMYGFVKGSIEDGETDVAAARREMIEETGLDLPEASFIFKKYFTQKRDPRTNPVYKVNVTPEQRAIITQELMRRNTENVGEIFNYDWVSLDSFNNDNLNETSKIIVDKLKVDSTMRAGGKTRRRKLRKTKRRYNK